MSNVFLQLHDFAMSSGALETNPEFGRQLQLTTEKFLALARKASEDNGKDDETGSTGSPKGSNSGRADGAKSSSPERTETPEAENNPTTQSLLYGGLTVTHEPLADADLISDFSSHLLPPPTTASLDFEVITQPTLENASFPFETPADFDFGVFSNPSPYSSLPLPRTYTSQEATFGRRLHRFASERALLLISMPNPPPDRFQRVFGFCLLMETREAIHQRLRRTVGRNIQENLSNWQYPFYNLGGAGTHFDLSSLGTQRVGNQGTIDVLKPQNTAGFSTGPFTPDISDIRDGSIDKEMHMDLQGFRGDYFDCDEVEIYLRQRGVTIPPGADFVTVEVDPAGLGANSITATTIHGSTGNTDIVLGALSVPTTEAGNNNNNNDFFSAVNHSGNTSTQSPTTTSSAESGSTSAMTTTVSSQPAATSSSSSSWNLESLTSLVDPLLSGVFSQAAGNQPSFLATAGLTDNLGLGIPMTSTSTSTSKSTATATATASLRRETVMVDVNTLITSTSSSLASQLSLLLPLSLSDLMNANAVICLPAC